MAKINLLDIQVANLIAAGEVVERPASALKELVENSIDAGASAITVEIKNGGITYMRITDNGEGMTGEDLGKSILRHATSKIASESDLSKIKTLGFRGEALAAISSVSDMKIFSRHRKSEQGYILEVSHGQNTRISEAGCAYGTTVVIEHLFAKIPARQKFLKRDATEGMYCKSVIEKIALSNPFVSLRFIQDGKEKIFTPGGGSYKNAVYSIYKDEVGDRLIPIPQVYGEVSDNRSAKVARIKISGFLCRFEDSKNTRGDENFFVNGRYIKSKTLLSAVEGAYDSVCETGKFPLCVLYVAIDESVVDVNVHPQKLEIKFADEREVFEAVYFAVKNTLEKSGISSLKDSDIYENENEDEDEYKTESYSLGENYINTSDTNTDTDKDKQIKELQVVEVIRHNFDKLAKYSDTPASEEKSVESNIEETERIRQQDAKDTANTGYIETIENINYNDDNDYNERNNKGIDNINNIDGGNLMINSAYKFIGEVFYGYIIIEKDEKVIVIDKHAAHERVIYDIMIEKAKNTVSRNMTQILLIPAEIRLSTEEIAGMFEFKEDIEKIGLKFEISEEDSDVILIREVPADIADINIEDIVREMAYMIAEENNHMAHESAFEKLIEITAKKTSACRAAMKSGIKDEPEHLMWLAEKVLNYEGVKYCPHGRPVAFEVTKRRLEKQFGR